MALEVTNNEPNWFHIFNLPDNSDTINNTPFDAWFIPTLNEPHVQLTEANVAWALDEIILETLSSPSNDLSVFKIERNPIKDELLILSNQSFDNSKITITDLTGKIFLQTILVFEKCSPTIEICSCKNNLLRDGEKHLK